MIIGLTDIIFFTVAGINSILGIWGAIRWYQCFRINHSRYRLLYLAWIIISIALAVNFAWIILDLQVVNIHFMITRILITLVLSASAVTSEIVQNFRTLQIDQERRDTK